MTQHLAPDDDPSLAPDRPPPRRVRLVPLTLGCLLVAASVLAPRLAPEAETLVVEESSQPARFASYVHQEGDDAGATRHKGEEGVMGRPSSKNKSGLYAMEGPRDAIPQMARSFDPDMAARNAGMLGMIRQESGHFLASPYGAAFAVGDDEGSDDEAVWGGLGGGQRVVERPLTVHPSEQAWQATRLDAQSTFSVDVDTASYATVRAALRGDAIPPAEMIRVEEMINYFDYDYPAPTGDDLVSVHAEVGPCPWNEHARLLRIGLRSAEVAPGDTPRRNLVFLVDVSGSMGTADRLPLVQASLRRLVDELDADDRIALVVYAGAAGMVLPPTAGDRKREILAAIDRLEAGGSTNGGDGIELAYALAARHFDPAGVNRVLLATDGDFNVGVTSHDALVELIEHKRKSGVYLSVLGFGVGASGDATMELLADKGNGNYAYVDSEREAHKVLVREGASTLVPIADDVKLQVEFFPDVVVAHRLVGYDNRRLAHADFTDDRKDAGELGAGHRVTALYEIALADGIGDGTLGELALRAKRPGERESSERRFPLEDEGARGSDTSDDFRFAAAAAGFGLMLERSRSIEGWSWRALEDLADGSRGEDPERERAEMVDLIGRAMRLVGEQPRVPARETVDLLARDEGRPDRPARPVEEPPAAAAIDWVEVVRLLPPLLALPMFVMAFRPRRRWQDM
jgi:Ca-activated chloride channel family protein